MVLTLLALVKRNQDHYSSFKHIWLVGCTLVLTLQALVKRNQDLNPSEKEQTALTSLVSKIQAWAFSLSHWHKK